MTTARDFTGEKYGLLTVVKKSAQRNGYGEIMWECDCDCGGFKLATSGTLKSGGVKSCGCIWGSPTHRNSGLRIRIIRVGMMARCYNKNAINWNKYGGSGICVCLEWQDYLVFKDWAFRNGYSDDLTLDRYPNKIGNYEPSNCRWATQKQQQNNRGNNKRIKFKGVVLTLSEWADRYNIGQVRLRRRLLLGWNMKEALTTPIDKNKISKCYRK